MANIKYRGNSTTPTKPSSTTAKNAPLTNDEIDGNLRSLNDGKLENNGWTPGDMFYADASGNLVRLPIGSTGNVLTPVGGYPAWQSSSAVLDTVNIQTFQTAGTTTWVKPTNAKMVHVVMYSGGSSGIAGTAYSSIGSSNAYIGGVGGVAGSRIELWLPASSLANSVTVVVGAGGAATTSSTNNNAGQNSSFGSYYASGPIQYYYSGGAVTSGSAFNGTQSRSVTSTSTYAYVENGSGTPYFTYFLGNGGGWSCGNSGGTIVVAATAGKMGGLGGGGGGSGGGINSNTFWNVGSDGGMGGGALFMTNSLYTTYGISGRGGRGGQTPGEAGSSGLSSYMLYSYDWDPYFGGAGGGGGASSVTGNGGAGGSGYYGAGGGGGGSCLSGFTPGAGGAGGDGYIKVTTYK